MKSFLCVILAFFITVSLFTACGDNGDNASDGKSEDGVTKNEGADAYNEFADGKEAVYLMSKTSIIGGGGSVSEGETGITEMRWGGYYVFSYNDNGTVCEKTYIMTGETTYPDGSTETENNEIKYVYQYNDAGLVSQIDMMVKGDCISHTYYSYDENGYVTEVIEVSVINGYDSSDKTVVKYTNNQNGQPVTVTETFAGIVTSTENYSYDSDGKLLSYSKIDSNGRIDEQEEYTYDSDGRILSYFDDKYYETYTYNDDGSYILNSEDANTKRAFSIQFNSEGQEIAYFDENGDMIREYVYDENNELTEIKDTFPRFEESIIFSRDAYGKVISVDSVKDEEKTNMLSLEYTLIYLNPEDAEKARKSQSFVNELIEQSSSRDLYLWSKQKITDEHRILLGF